MDSQGSLPVRHGRTTRGVNEYEKDYTHNRHNSIHVDVDTCCIRRPTRIRIISLKISMPRAVRTSATYRYSSRTWYGSQAMNQSMPSITIKTRESISAI